MLAARGAVSTPVLRGHGWPSGWRCLLLW